MSKTSPEKIAEYKAMCTEHVLDVKHDKTRAFLHRAFEEGYSMMAENFLTHHGFFQAPHTKTLTDVDIAILGVPMDQGAPHRGGTRHGPESARKWSHIHGPVNHQRIIPFETCNVIDWGDMEFNSYSAKERCDEIYEAFKAFKAHNIVPLTCGGEHTMSHPIMKALSGNQSLGLIHLDAHADTGATPIGGDDCNDVSIFRKAVLDGTLDPKRTVQIGIRGRASIMWDFSRDTGMRIFSADEVHDRGVEAVMDEALQIVGAGPAYLSVDTDAIDSTYMPGTTLPEPFGLTGLQTRNIIRRLKDVDLVGADIAELCPAHDANGISANLVAGLMFEMLCLLSEARTRRTGKTRKTHWKKP